MFKKLRAILTKMTRKKTTYTGDGMVSLCCGAGIDMVQVGLEMFVRCTECRKYIGNVVGRHIGILESNYEVYIAKACRERRITHLPRKGELEAMYPAYCQYLSKFAQQAARSTLKDHIAIE